MIVGRDRECAVLARVVESARRGSGAAAVVHGEPGIGKTVLLDALIGTADVRTLRACGFEAEADLPFATLADLVRAVLDDVNEIPAAQAHALSSAIGVGRASAVDPLTVAVATAELLRTAARRQPLLVVVDDVQWVDSDSLHAVLHLARRASQMPVAVVLAVRTHELTTAMAELPCLALGPLGADHAEALIRADEPEIASVVMQHLVERGRGNPLALREMLRGLSPQQRNGSVALDDPIEVAAEIVVAYRRRIDVLPAETRAALLFAVAEGRGNLACVLQALERSSSSVSAFGPAERDDLVVLGDGLVQFRHPLVRSVVYQTAEPAARRAAHAALARVDGDPDRCAWHLGSSAAGPDAAAAEALTQLGERALGRGADSTAAHALARAAELTADGDVRGRLYAKAARAANRGGDPPLASRLLALAVPLVGDDLVGRADLTLLDADLRMRHGDLHGAYLDLANQAESVAAVDPRRAMIMLLVAAKLHVYRMEAATGLATVHRALELADRGELDLLQMSSLGMTQTMAGDPQATATTRAAAEIGMATTRGHLHTLSIAWPLVWLELYELARRFLSWAIAAQRDGGHHSYLPQSLLPAAELDFRTDRWRRARAGALEAHQLFVETNQPTDAALAAGTLARIEAARGDDAGCSSWARTAIDGDVASGLQASTAFAHAGLGHVALSGHRYDDAIASLRRAQSIAEQGGVAELGLLQIHGDLAESLARRGCREESATVVAALRQHGERTARPSELAVAARCAGLLAPADLFIDHFQEALVGHAEAAGAFERARTQLCYGERLRRANRRVDARAPLHAARETFAELGAEAWAAWAASELRACGAEARRSEGTAPGAAGDLTARERDVARMVANGATNREVALRLFINEKTVEFHLGNVYRKLGLRSRSELAARYSRESED